ncbi:hypothetical protein GL272_08015 [Aeromonas veronii]|uniref:hypothetical protein n=1 Tax=Aeromonas veronii TaxID=654 RepID=UPI001C5AC848|nr:hypothetical protein [Aeromonas veronii]MBW3776889.1 hypothetical protein [Aeromonas veronii]
MDRLTRLKRRQALRAEWKKGAHLREALPAITTLPLLNAEIDRERINALSKPLSFGITDDITLEQARTLLSQLRHDFSQQRLEQLIDKTQHDVLQAIVSPLGLGKIIAQLDQDGGQVTTIHNAQQGIYAKEKDKYDRKMYTAEKNSRGERFEGNSVNSVGSRFTRRHMDEQGYVTDAYTGRGEKASHTSPDHITSNHEFHRAGGFMHDPVRKADFATDEDNLAITRRDINQSMRDDDKREWAKKCASGRDMANDEYFSIDRDRLEHLHQQGQSVKERHLPCATEKLKYYTLNGTKAGMLDGIKMGAQQALGWLLVEFFSGLIQDMKTCFVHKYAFKKACLYLLQQGRTRMANLNAKRKELFTSFTDGLMSGIFSSLLTLVINLFKTTYRRHVRLIREGIFTLCRALKTLIFPAQGTSWRESAQAALLLIFNGSIVIAGISLESSIELLLAPIPFGGLLSGIITGALCAMAMAWLTHWLEKRDFFGLRACEEDQFIHAALDNMLALPENIRFI